jgi:hypothetical protein
MGAVFLAERDDDEYRAKVAVKLVRPGMDTEFIRAISARAADACAAPAPEHQPTARWRDTDHGLRTSSWSIDGP